MEGPEGPFNYFSWFTSLKVLWFSHLQSSEITKSNKLNGLARLSLAQLSPSLFNTYGWVKMCLVSSCLDTGHVRTEYFLTKTFRSKFFRFQNILGEQKIHRPKFWGFRNILESKFFGPDFFCLIFSWHQNLAQLKSRVWHFQPSLFFKSVFTSDLHFSCSLQRHHYCSYSWPYKAMQ